MVSKEPPKPSLILATPVNVEESRAQRLQRQQSRFRDRGGIFVPSSRNTLADILLGKASPLKRPPRRSVSASPTKGKAHTPNGAAQDLVLTARHASSRKSSPLKQTRKALTSKADDAKVKTPASVKAIDDGATRAKGSQADSSSKSKTVAKTSSKHSDTKVPGSLEENLQRISAKGTENTGTSIVAKFKAEGRARKAATTSTKSRKSQGSAAPSKSKGKGKAHEAAASETLGATVPKPAEAPAKSKSVAIPSQSSNFILSSTVVEPFEPLSSRRRKSTLYSDGFSEDEYIPKQVKRTKGKTQSAVPDKKKASKPPAPSKQSAKAPPSPSNQNKTGAPQLPDIPEEDEEDISNENDFNEPAFKQQDAPSAKKSSKTISKRAAQEADLDQEQPQQPKKRAKKSEKEDKDTRLDKLKAKTQKKVSRKRPRNENIVNEADGEGSKKKRKEVVDHSETEAEPKIKSSTKPTKPKSTTGNGRGSSGEGKSTSKWKKEDVAMPQKVKTSAAAPVKRGPPKRVLQRLKDCQHHDVDNEPDPIDFLS